MKKDKNKTAGTRRLFLLLRFGIVLNIPVKVIMRRKANIEAKLSSINLPANIK